jgi:hypothetical protein
MRHLFLGSTLLALGACGEPSHEARVANFLQTVMANAIEAYLLKSGGTAELDCSKGGQLAYTAGALSNPGDEISDLAVTFTKCGIDACGKKIVFDGNENTTLRLLALSESQIADIVTGGTGLTEDDQFLELEISAEDQSVTGFLRGNLTFSYRMRIVGSEASLKGVQILDAEDGKPLKLNGRTYKASELSALADGC